MANPQKRTGLDKETKGRPRTGLDKELEERPPGGTLDAPDHGGGAMGDFPV